MLRYGLLYGPGTWYARGAATARVVADRDVASFVHVDDAAAAALDALAWPAGTFNVCDDEPAAGHDLAPVFCAAIGAPPPPVKDRERTPWACGADNRRARRELGGTSRHPTWRHGFLTGVT